MGIWSKTAYTFITVGVILLINSFVSDYTLSFYNVMVIWFLSFLVLSQLDSAKN